MAGLQQSKMAIRSGLAFAATCRAGRISQSYSNSGIAFPASMLLQRSSFNLIGEQYISTESLPKIAQPAFWRYLVPKPLRRKRDATVGDPKPKKKEWNPATFYIAMVMLIGSQAIQMIALRSSFVEFSNQTEARLAKLRRVVESIQKGEDVNVEKLLGTGDQTAEREWEQVIRELEEEDDVYRRKRKELRQDQRKPGSDSESPTEQEASRP